jgi:hypothetical protein
MVSGMADPTLMIFTIAIQESRMEKEKTQTPRLTACPSNRDKL